MTQFPNSPRQVAFRLANAHRHPVDLNAMSATLEAYDNWAQGDDDCVDIQTGKALLRDLIGALRNTDAHGTTVQAQRAAEALLKTYIEFDGDLDGEATMALHVAMAELGYPVPVSADTPSDFADRRLIEESRS